MINFHESYLVQLGFKPATFRSVVRRANSCAMEHRSDKQIQRIYVPRLLKILQKWPGQKVPKLQCEKKNNELINVKIMSKPHAHLQTA